MNCGNAFQIYLYLENHMTNRASYFGAQREYYRREKVMPLLCKACQTFSSHSSTTQVSSWHGWWQCCSVFLQKSSSEDTHWMFHPSGRHTWWHWSGQNADSVSSAFPYENKRIPAAQLDRWMEKLQHTPGSYPVNQSGKIFDLSQDYGAHMVTVPRNGQDRGRNPVHDLFNLSSVSTICLLCIRNQFRITSSFSADSFWLLRQTKWIVGKCVSFPEESVTPHPKEQTRFCWFKFLSEKLRRTEFFILVLK